MTYQLNHVKISRQGHLVLDDLCLTMQSGRVIGLIGPNGAGKSTLLAALAGDLKVDQGQIEMDGQAFKSLSPEQLAKRRSILTQQATAIFNLTVRQVLELGLYAFEHWPRPDRESLLADVAKLTHICEWLHQSITTLSLGQQQRVHFARTLVQAKACLKERGNAWWLLDEPTASQDPRQQQMMMSVCRAFANQSSSGVLLVMHDLSLAAQWCDEIIVLKNKGLLAHGKTRDVLTADTLRQVYGSELDVKVFWDPLIGVIMSSTKAH